MAGRVAMTLSCAYPGGPGAAKRRGCGANIRLGGNFGQAPLGVSAGQLAQGEGAVGVPTCGLSHWMHGVWSPSGPQPWSGSRVGEPSFVRYAPVFGSHRWPGSLPLPWSVDVGLVLPAL